MAGIRTFLLFIFITHFLTGSNAEQVVHREALEIIIGGGGGAPPPETEECPPPPPPPCPPPTKLPPPPPPPPPPPSPSPPPPVKQPPKKSPPPVKPPPKKSPPPSPKPPRRRPPSSLDGFESERLKLVYPVIQAFKQKVTIDPLGIRKTWTGKNICQDYKGFVCDTRPDIKQRALAGVKFNNYGFAGPNLTLHDFLNKLPDIVFFHANSNNFTGTIPSDINTIKYFYELDLSNNKFEGKFPTQVLNANKLLFLDLRFNSFAGLVPPQVFFLKLDLLFINNNNFIQTLPENLGSTTALYLTLANNKFIGGIPKSIGQASDTLLEVLFLNNKLSGCLPYEIGLLKKSTVFDVGFNELVGPIPHSFQCLRKMELLNLAHNLFSGTVPEEVCGLPALSNFTISYNYFTQVGPKCRKLIDEKVLDVKMNCILDLPNQRSAADCQKFFSQTHPSCVNDRSLTYVPCKGGYLDADQLESSDVQWTAPSPALEPAQAPRGWGSYGALSPH